MAFRGTNLWLLVFAILVASIGLNVNSTAVIIGAMLISPLMGPIMAAGYGVAVADFELLRRALGNLARATVASLLASALYFSISPLSQAHSELLARTTPSVWDVGIALFGGLAGIVGLTRKETSNVVPGVAIATALMPPLCTAGYGIATGQPTFFLGAFYLFFINSVFIAAATGLMVRVMHLPVVQHVDAATRARARRWIAFVVTLTLVPSVLLARQIVATELFQIRAQRLLADALPEDGPTLVVNARFDASERLIRVTLVGEELSEVAREALNRSLPAYGLRDARVVVNQQARDDIDVEGLRQAMTEDLYEGTLRLLERREAQVATLEARLAEAERSHADGAAISVELAALLPEAAAVAVTTGRRAEHDVVVALVEQEAPLSTEELSRLEGWLRTRASADEARVLRVSPTSPPETPLPPSP